MVLIRKNSIFSLLVAATLPASLSGTLAAQDAANILQRTRQALDPHFVEISGTIRYKKITQPFSLTHQKGKASIKTNGAPTPITFSVQSANTVQHTHQVIAPGIPLSPSDLIWSWLRSREPSFLGSALFKTRKTWRLSIPDPLNQHAHTQVWIDQASYAPLKAEYYDQNILSRRTELISGQKINGQWLPREIRIEKFSHAGQRLPASRSYVEISEYQGNNSSTKKTP
jgi:hypothetical protein